MPDWLVKKSTLAGKLVHKMRDVSDYFDFTSEYSDET